MQAALDQYGNGSTVSKRVFCSLVLRQFPTKLHGVRARARALGRPVHCRRVGRCRQGWRWVVLVVVVVLVAVWWWW